MIALRHKDGGRRFTRHFADFLSDSAGQRFELGSVPRGTVESARSKAPRDSGGGVVRNGTSNLESGSVVAYSRNGASQMLVRRSTFIYFVIKVKEK